MAGREPPAGRRPPIARPRPEEAQLPALADDPMAEDGIGGELEPLAPQPLAPQPLATEPLATEPAPLATEFRRRQPLDRRQPIPALPEAREPYPALPGRREGSGLVGWIIFVLALLVGAAGTVYYLRYASDRYVTAAHFTVRLTAAVQQGGGAPTPMPATGMGGGASSVAVGGGSYTDTFMLSEYLRSASVVADIGRKVDLRAMFSRPGIDPLSRLDPQATQEDLDAYFRKRVTVDFDPMTATAQFRVEAFAAQDSMTLATALLDAARALINEMDKGAVNDMVAYARAEVDRAAAKLQSIRVSRAALPQAAAPAGNGAKSAFLQASQLQIDRDIAEQSYAHAVASLQIAQETAARNQRYMVVYVNPVLPVGATLPVRWLSILTFWVGTFLVAGILGLVAAMIRDHLR